MTRITTPLFAVLSLCIGGIACFMAVQWLSADSIVDNKHSPAVIEKRYLDFGKEWERDDFKWKLVISNRGRERLRVSKLAASCSCTKVSPAQLELLPGQSGEIVLTIDLRPKVLSTAEFVEERSVSIAMKAELQHGNEIAEIGWLVHGISRPLPIRINPNAIDFGDVNATSSTRTPIEVEVICDEPGAKLIADCNAKLATIRIGETSATRRRKLTISLQQNLPVGVHKIPVALAISPDETSGERPPPAVLSAIVRVLENVSCVPSEVYFGPIARGKPTSQLVTLASASGEQFQVDDISAAPGITVKAKLSDPPSRHVYQISVEGDALGPQCGDIEFYITDNSDHKSYSVPLKVSYFTVEGARFTPTSKNDAQQ